MYRPLQKEIFAEGVFILDKRKRGRMMHTKQTVRTTAKTVNGDLLTPISIFQRLHGQRKFLLESSDKYGGAGRYSFIGTNPRKLYHGNEEALTDYHYIHDKTYVYEGELLRSIKQVMPRVSSNTELPFTGGAIGYIDTHKQEALFQIYDTLIIFDHLTDTLTIFHTNIEAEHQTPNFEEVLAQLFTARPTEQTSYTLTPFVNQQATFTGDPLALYRKLRVQLASAYLYYIEFDDKTIIGAEQESLLSVQNRHVSANLFTPIAVDVQQRFKSICVEGSTQLDESVTTTKLNGALQPTLHPIEALAQFVPKTGALGYIGFNGQLDFTQMARSITISEQQAITQNEDAFNVFVTGGANE